MVDINWPVPVGAASYLEPLMADDTTDPSYWLNWRFFLCALWIIISMIIISVLIIKYEVFTKKKTYKEDDELDEDPIGILYEDETWRTSLKSLHPAWLLVYRLFAFGVMLALLVTNLIIEGADTLFFYTQWTFSLVTFYFGLASFHSIYGCYQYWNGIDDDSINNAIIDHERGTYMAPSEGLSSQSMPINPPNHILVNVRKTAGVWGYIFQIVFQTCSGAVGLTDSVFWFIIYPFLTPAEYNLNFLDVTMHSVNAVLLLIDIVLNRLRFPFFRLAYFGLWTCTFVIFQWIVHACVSMWWPYSFLDLSSPYAPIWYLGVGLIHLPAYGIFALIVRGKQLLLSRFHDTHGA
ncbi:hypothetical protein L1987_72437 [Smallanthus sonchifolius]|uniref:Uncharacterized protein n=1 Tax=Smallanthus sonchifolius TaxID=185202 RepID=A0ACB9AVX5_9ASTR|nr:hypothetical protein L1987_72437 [Smallanthus sonchifolius]